MSGPIAAALSPARTDEIDKLSRAEQRIVAAITLGSFAGVAVGFVFVD